MRWSLLMVALALLVLGGCGAAPTHPGPGTDVEDVAVDATLHADGTVAVRHTVAFRGDGGDYSLAAPRLATIDDARVDGAARSGGGERIEVDARGPSSIITAVVRGATERHRDVARVVIPLWAAESSFVRRPVDTVPLEATVRLPAPPVGEVHLRGTVAGTVTVDGATLAVRGGVLPDRGASLVALVPASSVPTAPIVRDDDRGTYFAEREAIATADERTLDAELAARRDRQRLIDRAYWTLVALQVAVPVLIVVARLQRAARRRLKAGAGVPRLLHDPPASTPPAVVALLAAGGHDIGDAAVAATVVDLARNGVVTIEARGAGRWRLTAGAVDPAVDSVSGPIAAAVGAIAPVEGPPLPLRRGPWLRAFRHAVVATARSDGLITRRLPSGLFVASVIGLAITTGPLWVRSPESLTAGIVAAAAVVALPFVGGYVLTEQGAALRARWDAFARFIDEHGDMDDVDPPGVVLWGPYLAHGAALGHARRVVRELGVVASALAVAVGSAFAAAAVDPAAAGAQPAACAVGSRSDFRARRADGRFVQARLSGIDLRCQDLSGLQFGQAELTGANLHRARLDGADFTQADMEGADLRESSAVGVDLGQAKLTRAHLDGADLTGADLVQTTLTEATMQETRLAKAELGQAHLERADLSRAVLREADLTQASLDGAILAGADLAGVAPSAVAAADRRGTPFAPVDPAAAGTMPECAVGSRRTFRDTVLDPSARLGDLGGIDLACQDLTGLSFSATNLRGARLARADLSGVEMFASDLTGLDLREVRFAGADLTSSTLNRADLRGTDFAGAKLSSVKFVGADARRARFDDADMTSADLSDADLRDASLRDVELLAATANGALFAGADLQGADGLTFLRGADLEGARNVPESAVRRWGTAIAVALAAIVILVFLVRRTRGIARDA